MAYNFYPHSVIRDSTTVTSASVIAPGVRLARFLGAKGDPITLNHLTAIEKAQVARNLQPNAMIFQSIKSNKGEFRDDLLEVIEGVYKAGPQETITPNSLNDYAAQGRSVVYELYDVKGRNNDPQLFNLAVYIKNVHKFQTLILDYDTIDPSGALNAQLIVVMPKLDENYNVVDGSFSNQCQTIYNGLIQSNTDLIEILE